MLELKTLMLFLVTAAAEIRKSIRVFSSGIEGAAQEV